MPRSSTGKWVARAGATGGGRTYRGQVPVNWYAALVIIVVLGVLSVVYSRYQYQNPKAAAATVQPTTKTTWYAGFAFYVCGKQEPSVPANVQSTGATKQSFYTTGKGVITVAPKTAAVSGHNATFGKFVSAYKGMAVTTSKITIPSAKKATTYTNGQTCPAGTPDAGKKGTVQVAYWPNAFNSKAKSVTLTGDPATLRFSDNQLITIGFVPKGTKLPKPNGTVVTALVQASTSLGSSSTPTTAPTTATTVPGATSTTAPATTSTTAPATTTTAPKTTTTTGKK